MMWFVTDFADGAVLVPVAAVLLAWAVARRRGFALGVGVGGAVVVSAVLKLVLHGCGVTGVLHSPSGHTAFAASLAGGVGGLLGGSVVALVVSAGVATVIGATRLLLHLHSVVEVGVGAAIGVAGAMTVAALSRTKVARPGVAVVIVVVALVVALHGKRLPAESAIDDAARTVWPFSACARWR